MMAGGKRRPRLRTSRRRKSRRGSQNHCGEHPRGPGLRNTQGMLRQGWTMHTRRTRAREQSTCHRASVILHHRTLRLEDPHNGASRSASHPSAINAVLNAIQHSFHFTRAGGSIEQGNRDLSSQCAVCHREPVRCFLPVTQDVDRLRQGGRRSDHYVGLCRRQSDWRSTRVSIAASLPPRSITESTKHRS